MKIPEKINLSDCSALSRAIAKTRRTGLVKFRLEASERDCCNGIWSAYSAIVTSNGGTCEMTDDLRQRITEVARWLISEDGKPGLMMLGTLGNGKTTMADAIATLIRYIGDKSESPSDRIDPTFVKAKKVCEQFVRYPDDYEKLRTARILVIDDLGEEAKKVVQYGMAYTPMLDLLEERYDRRRCTIVTTNLSMSDLGEQYGERLRDRFREMYEPVLFTSPSFRK